MSIANLPFLLFVLSFHNIYGYTLATTLSFGHKPTSMIDDSNNLIYKHSKESEISYDSTLHSKKISPKHSFERKMYKLHSLSDAVAKTLENNEEMGIFQSWHHQTSRIRRVSP